MEKKNTQRILNYLAFQTEAKLMPVTHIYIVDD